VKIVVSILLTGNKGIRHLSAVVSYLRRRDFCVLKQYGDSGSSPEKWEVGRVLSAHLYDVDMSVVLHLTAINTCGCISKLMSLLPSRFTGAAETCLNQDSESGFLYVVINFPSAFNSKRQRLQVNLRLR